MKHLLTAMLVLFLSMGALAGADAITSVRPDKFAVAQINTDQGALQFLLDGEAGKMWEIRYDDKGYAYLIEIPIVTKEQAFQKGLTQSR